MKKKKICIKSEEIENKIIQSRCKKKRIKKRSVLKILLVFLITVLGTVALFVAYAFSSAQKILEKTYVQNTTGSSIKSDEPLTILLMGVDTGDSERGGSESWNGNSDSQIVLTLNPHSKTATMVSLQRDTMTNILDVNGDIVSTQKMNAAYPVGYNENGLETAASYAMKTIGAQAGIPINNFVAINMDGLVNLVNDVGGIDVINNSGNDIFISNTEPQYTAVVPFIGEGKSQHIDGEQALVYARDRDHLPNGDYGRSAHQREVFQKIMQKILSLNNILAYQKFLNNISNDFRTNISVNVENLKNLMAYKDCFNKVVSIQYQGLGDTAVDSFGNSASYQFVPNDVYLAVQNTLKKSIGQPTIQSLGSDIITYENQFGLSPEAYFFPSATVTEKGKESVTYGLSIDGTFVILKNQNQQKYISTTGDSL